MTSPNAIASNHQTDRRATFDVAAIRADFPILNEMVHGKPLVYLDNAATSQKPTSVIEALSEYYTTYNANIHRGVHALSQRGTEAYEASRAKIRSFINAAHDHEIIFTRGTTEGINLVAHGLGKGRIGPGDEIVISVMEHHSNIVPWQILCQETGARLRVAPINDAGELCIDDLEALLGPATKLVSIVHMSNALGTINPVKRIVEAAHRCGALVLLDGAQATPHLHVDVQALDCDFYAFSGHKLFGPTGVGVLYGKSERLEELPPYQSGGDMIKSVTFEKTTYNDLPHRFEAGTPNIAGVIGLGAAVDYVTKVGLDPIAAYEDELLAYGTKQLTGIPRLRLMGTAAEKASILNFTLDGIHPHDIGTILDMEGVAIRSGHHCTQPLMARFGVPATARASLAFYNTREEIDVLVQAIHKSIEVLG